MHTLFKKSISLFFVLTLIFSPLGVFLAPKVEASAISGGIAGCASGFVTGYISSFFKAGSEVPTDDLKNNLKECMDSIAYALAKTLLAEFTDTIITWINSGFEGNPFYVGDMASFFKDTIEGELRLALEDIKNTGSIYFDVLRQEAIYGARRTLRDELGFSLDADIVNGICGYAEYENEEFCSGQLTPEAQSELTRAYTQGYIPFQWSTWDSLTQHCGNNVFCSNTTALNYQLAQRQERVEQLNTELNRGGGFLGQKTCKDPGYQRDLEIYKEAVEALTDPDFVGPPDPDFPERPVCREEIIETPGRIIADKLTSNLGTTERQYELADELNESIAAIFNALFDKLLSEGLSSFNQKDGDGTGDYYDALNGGDSGFGTISTIENLDGNQVACERAGGVFNEITERCDTDGVPDFPWTMEDGTLILNEAGYRAFVETHPDQCIEIDGIQVPIGGEEPCITGVSGNGTLLITPDPLVIGGTATFTITGGPANTDFEIAYNTEDNPDLEFLTSGVTEVDGSGVATAIIPTTDATEITITVSFGEDITIEQVVQIGS